MDDNFPKRVIPFQNSTRIRLTVPFGKHYFRIFKEGRQSDWVLRENWPKGIG